jgi:hypothetical protein
VFNRLDDQLIMHIGVKHVGILRSLRHFKGPIHQHLVTHHQKLGCTRAKPIADKIGLLRHSTPLCVRVDPIITPE